MRSNADLMIAEEFALFNPPAVFPFLTIKSMVAEFWKIFDFTISNPAVLNKLVADSAVNLDMWSGDKKSYLSFETLGTEIIRSESSRIIFLIYFRNFLGDKTCSKTSIKVI